MNPSRNLFLAILVALFAFVYFTFLTDDGPDHIPTPAETVRTWISDYELLSAGQQAEALASAVSIQQRHSARLFGIPQVAATAVGLSERGGLAIQVYAADGPDLALMPPVLEGIPVVVREAGPFYALQGLEAGAEPQSEGSQVVRTGRFERPVPIGISTGHKNSTAGTIGALVTDGEVRYALSNYHVFAAGPDARVGDNLMQPGVYDGGADPDDVIGTLAAFQPIKFSMTAANRIDAAIARTDQVDSRTPSDGYGAPQTVTVAARPGMKVKKYGRTTGLTFGRVDGVNATVNVRYKNEAQTARFTGQIIVCCSTSAGGDSGSLIVTDDTTDRGASGSNDRKPVGLLFAGDGFFTMANPIDEVLSAFKVTIVGDR
jgi:hypothetical protein